MSTMIEWLLLSLEPPSYNEGTNHDQLKLSDENYQHPGGSQYSSPGGGPYTDSQFQPQCTSQDQVMIPLVRLFLLKYTLFSDT